MDRTSQFQNLLFAWRIKITINYIINLAAGFSSAGILLEKKILVCGTIRENLGLPTLLIGKSKNFQRGQMTVRKGSIVLLAWKDKRLEHMISIIHDTSMISSGKRNKIIQMMRNTMQ